MQVDLRRGDLAIAVLLLALAAFFLWGAWRMPAGTFAVPGPGIAPTILGALLGVMALVLLIKTLIASAPDAGLPVSFGVAPVAIVFAALTAVAVAFEHAGFPATLSAFLFVMLRVFSRLGTLRSVLVAVGIVLAAGWFFGSLLGVNLLRIPYVYLAPVVLLICVVGIYSVSAKPLDIFIMAAFGVLGYVLRKFDFDIAPLLLAVVLGDRMEVSLRRALVISDGDYGIFLQGAISQVFIGAIVLLALLQGAAWVFGFRKKVFRELK